MNYSRILKRVIIISVSLIALYTILEISLPIIFDYFWPVKTTPTKSLKAVLKMQTELYTLENELLMLSSGKHRTITDFEKDLEPQFDAIELKLLVLNHHINSNGHLDMTATLKLFKTCKKAFKLLGGASETIDEIKEIRLIQLSVYETQLIGLSHFWPRWKLYKYLDSLADTHFIFDQQQHEPYITDNFSLKESMELVKTLLQLFKRSEKITHHVVQLLKSTQDVPNSSKSEKRQSEIRYEVSYKLNELQDVKNRMAKYYADNKVSFGRVYSEVVKATERIQKLFKKVVENEKNHWSSLENRIIAKRNSIENLQKEAEKSYHLNFQLTMAYDLDSENTHQEL